MFSSIARLAAAAPAVVLLLATAAAPSSAADGPANISCNGGILDTALDKALPIAGDAPVTISAHGTTSGCRETSGQRRPATLSFVVEGSGSGSCLPSLGVPRFTVQNASLEIEVGGEEFTAQFTGVGSATIEGAGIAGTVLGSSPYKGKRVTVTGQPATSQLPGGAAACVAGGLNKLGYKITKLSVSN